MSIADTISALQTRHAAITGVRNAPVEHPGGILSGDCPFVLVDPRGPATTRWRAYQGDAQEFNRVYRVRCFVKPLLEGQGQEYKQLAITLLQRFLDNYLGEPDLSATTAIVLEQGIRDNGITDELIYGETQFRGFVLEVPVQERIDQ